jgi:DNA polymerase IV
MAIIMCVQVPSLSIAVARRDDPTLTGMPVMLYRECRQDATVVAASSETGVTPGMPLRQALVRCPNALVRPAAPDRDRQTLVMLVDLLHACSPRVAAHPLTCDAQIDLDLGPCTLDHIMTHTQRIAEQIQADVRLTPALGVAATRFVAHFAATMAGASATIIVRAGEETMFLAPHSVATLPIDGDITRRLHLLGLQTIGELARLPLDALQAQFGDIGRTLYHLARGGSERVPIGTAASAPIRTQRGRFAGPLADRGLLDRAIERLAARLATQLAQEGWAARTIVVTLPLEEGTPWIGQRTLSTPTTDQALLTQAFLALSRTASLDAGVEAITLQACDLVPTVVIQHELFAPTAGQADARDAMLARLHSRYASSFVRVQLDDLTAVLPEQRVRFDSWEPR